MHRPVPGPGPGSAEGPAAPGPWYLCFPVDQGCGGCHERADTPEGIARYVVTQAVWAPSVHNTQPWRFTADCRQISLYADFDRGLPVADPDGREMMISC